MHPTVVDPRTAALLRWHQQQAFLARLAKEAVLAPAAPMGASMAFDAKQQCAVVRLRVDIDQRRAVINR